MTKYQVTVWGEIEDWLNEEPMDKIQEYFLGSIKFHFEQNWNFPISKIKLQINHKGKTKTENKYGNSNCDIYDVRLTFDIDTRDYQYNHYYGVGFTPQEIQKYYHRWEQDKSVKRAIKVGLKRRKVFNRMSLRYKLENWKKNYEGNPLMEYDDWDSIEWDYEPDKDEVILTGFIKNQMKYVFTDYDGQDFMGVEDLNVVISPIERQWFMNWKAYPWSVNEK
jgi:hypothetical protein